VNVSLVMVTSDGKTREFPLAKLPANIGRGDDAKVRVPLPSVSRKHCELLIDEDDEFSVKDLNSSNGTYVNGERVRTRELVPGDLLAIGPVVFVVRIDGHPKDIDPVESYAAGAVAVGGIAEGSADRRTQMIEGVPSWTGQAGVERAAKDEVRKAPPAAAAPKSASDDEEDAEGDKDVLGSLLDDFDFGEEEEEEKKQK
jgi:predicted component of type VI protein secretion system